MKLFEKKDSSIKIEEDDLQDAKLSSLDFGATTTRKRAFLNVLGARLAMKMLFSQKVEATNLYSLYTIHNVLRELDIADIYVQGIKIDVRVVFDKEEIFIPKSHFELDLLPDVYLVFDLAQDFSCVECLGFFEPKTLNTQNENKDFYFYECDRLQDPKSLKGFLHDYKGSGEFKPPVILENAEALFVSLVDKEISEREKITLFQCLAGDIELREKIVEFENFETLSKEVAKAPDLMQDNIFDIVGAQQIYGDEELTIEEEKAEVIGEVLDDLLGEEYESGESDKAAIEIEDKKTINHDDLEALLSEVEAEAEADEKDATQDNTLGAFAAGAAAGAIVGGVVAGGAAVAAAAGAGLENNLIDALPDVNLDLDLNFGNEVEELVSLDDLDTIQETPSVQEENKYETVESNEDLLDELSKLEGMEDFDSDEEEIEDDSAIQAKFFGNLDNEEIGNSEWEIDDSEHETLNDERYEEVSEAGVNVPDEEETISLEEISPVVENDISFDENLSDLQPLEEDVVPFEQIESDNVVLPTNYDRVFDGGEDENLERLRQLEDQEEKIEEGAEDVSSDEMISQVDELLQDTEFLGKNAELIEGALDLDNLDDAALLAPLTPVEEETQPSAPIYHDEDASDHPQVNISDEQINMLFKDENLSEMPDLNIEEKDLVPEPVKKPSGLSGLKDKKMLIAASVAGIMLVSYLVTQNVSSNNAGTSAVAPTNAPITAQGQTPVSPGSPDANAMAPAAQNQDTPDADTGMDPLLQPAPAQQGNPQANVSKDMNKAVSDAFLSEPVSASISKVAWEVPEDLAYNDGFRKYLQIAGKNLKLNLQNHLLLATEMAYSNKVVVDLTINKDGSLSTSNIVTSSGSKQIDKIVLQSVKETLTYLKIPASEVSGNSVDATLIINF